MRATQENYSTKSQLAHVEKEQVDIKADIKIIQHDIITIKETMSTKADVSNLQYEIKAVENRLEAKIDLIKSDISWLKVLNIAILTIVLGIAFAPMAQSMFKAPVQEVISIIPSKQ